MLQRIRTVEELLGGDNGVTYAAFLECAMALTGEREARRQVWVSCACVFIVVSVLYNE